MDLTFKINNGGIMRMFQEEADGPVLVYREPDGEQFLVHPGEMVMLMNYFRACKGGLIASEFIAPARR